jgi:hypothetical protein
MATQGRKGTKEVQAPGLFSLFSLSDSSLIFPWSQFCEEFCASLKSLMVLVAGSLGQQRRHKGTIWRRKKPQADAHQ